MKRILQLKVACGSCSRLVRERLHDVPCAALGKLPSSRACGSHRPDAFSLVCTQDKASAIGDIAHAMFSMGDSDLQALGTLIIREKATRKAGFFFNQKVYVRIMGGGNSNFMSNFIVGHVLDANPEYVRIFGDSGKIVLEVLNDTTGCTLFTVPRFRELRKEMMVKGNLVDKNALRPQRVLALDEAVKSGRVTKNVKKAQRDDLVAFARRATSGQFSSKRSRETSTTMFGADGSVVIGA